MKETFLLKQVQCLKFMYVLTSYFERYYQEKTQKNGYYIIVLTYLNYAIFIHYEYLVGRMEINANNLS